MISRLFGRALGFAGRNGAIILFFGAGLGLALPDLAAAARPLMGVAVFTFTLGAFLEVDFVSLRREVARTHLALRLLLWSAFGVPLATLGLVSLAGPGWAMADALMLVALAPPVGSAAAIAAMLGLSAPLALMVTVVPTALAPLYLPLLGERLTGHALAIDPGAMALALLLIVVGALAVAALLRAHAGRFVAEHPRAMTGIAVLGLMTVAVGAMDGLQPMVLARPGDVLAVFALAVAVNLGFQMLGALLFADEGAERALTMGLVSGNRNVTLVWAAAGASLAGHPQIELFLAMSTVAIFTLPLVLRPAVGWLLRHAPAPELRMVRP